MTSEIAKQLEPVRSQLATDCLTLKFGGDFGIHLQQDQFVQRFDSLHQFAEHQQQATTLIQETFKTGCDSLNKLASEFKKSSQTEIESSLDEALRALGASVASSETFEETNSRLEQENLFLKRKADEDAANIAALQLQLFDAKSLIGRLTADQASQEQQARSMLKALQSGEELLQTAAANLAKQHALICELQDENLQLIDNCFVEPDLHTTNDSDSTELQEPPRTLPATGQQAARAEKSESSEPDSTASGYAPLLNQAAESIQTDAESSIEPGSKRVRNQDGPVRDRDDS